MSGAGSMLDMQNTLKHNRSLKRFKRRKFRNQNATSLHVGKKPIKRKEISDEKLDGIKKDIRTRVKKERRKNQIVSITLFSLFGLLLLYFWSHIF